MFEGLAPWLNRVPGRLMHVNILGCGIFGSVRGSSAATCATIAKVALPELMKRGYDENTGARLAGHRRHAGHPDPAVDHHGGLRGRRRSLDHPHLPRRLPAGLPADGAVLRLHRVWALRNPSKMPPAEPPLDASCEKLRKTGNLIPCIAADRLHRLGAGRRLGHRHRVRGLRRARLAGDRLASGGRSTWSNFWESLMGATRTCRA